MVVSQHATESFSTADFTLVAADQIVRLYDLIVESLMISFGVIMCQELTNCITQRMLTEEDHSVEILGC